jgi:muramoyltetrapeptide carboxypeptidase
MITPEYLKPGDKVGFVAPARSVTHEEVDFAIEVFKNHQLEVVPGANLFLKHNQYSGSDIERTDDFQQFLDNPEIKAIVSVRGGYGSVRTLQNINFRKFIKKPKWIVGYSDITVFHSYINNHLGIETLHAPMAFNIGKESYDKESVQKTFEILLGHPQNYLFESNPLNCQGKAKGVLIGGNLSVIYSLRGTPADLNTQGKLLFLEDIDEYLYHIDRMMMNLKYGGKLLNLRAVIVGSFTDMRDNATPFGKNAFEIISENLSELGIPVCFDFPAGHGTKNLPLILGREVILNLGKVCELKFC